jgi:Zn-dependent M28 family amino/carboxypeptidase
VELALAEHFTRSPARRSILLVWHTAEEKGLFGATYFTDHPTVPRDSIVAEVNMDQVSRGGPADVPGSRADALFVLGSRRLSTGLGDLVERVNAAAPRPFALDYALDAPGHPAMGYCRSDHYLYARYGIPIVFFSRGWHRDYHMVTDEAQYVDLGAMQRVAGLVRDVVGAVAELDRRPVVDAPRPDPGVPCRQ